MLFKCQASLPGKNKKKTITIMFLIIFILDVMNTVLQIKILVEMTLGKLSLKNNFSTH